MLDSLQGEHTGNVEAKNVATGIAGKEVPQTECVFLENTIPGCEKER